MEGYREKPGVWSSARYLLRRDGMGLTLTETTVAAGSSQTMQYKNHVEANLIIEGEGDVTDLATGRVHRLKPARCTPSTGTTGTASMRLPTCGWCACSLRRWRDRRRTTRMVRIRCWRIEVERVRSRNEAAPTLAAAVRLGVTGLPRLAHSARCRQSRLARPVAGGAASRTRLGAVAEAGNQIVARRAVDDPVPHFRKTAGIADRREQACQSLGGAGAELARRQPA